MSFCDITKKYYAGIGSRDTPNSVLKEMEEVASILSDKGYILNSGGAAGADHAFESGSDYDNMQIFLPWDGFEKKYVDNKAYFVPEYNEELVREYHPKFEKLTPKGRLFMSRNSNQVLGADLNTPVDFIMCWTQNGEMKGGTAQAMRIAKSKHIPIFNFFHGVDQILFYIDML